MDHQGDAHSALRTRHLQHTVDAVSQRLSAVRYAGSLVARRTHNAETAGAQEQFIHLMADHPGGHAARSLCQIFPRAERAGAAVDQFCAGPLVDQLQEAGLKTIEAKPEIGRIEPFAGFDRYQIFVSRCRPFAKQISSVAEGGDVHGVERDRKLLMAPVAALAQKQGGVRFALLIESDRAARRKIGVVKRDGHTLRARPGARVVNDVRQEALPPAVGLGVAGEAGSDTRSRYEGRVGAACLCQLPLRIAVPGRGKQREGVDPCGQRLPRIALDCARNRSYFLKKSLRVLTGLPNARTRQNVVELIEQHIQPGLTQPRGGIGLVNDASRQRRQRLRLHQIVLPEAVPPFDGALRCVASREFEVQFVGQRRDAILCGSRSFCLDRFEVADGRAKGHFRIDRPLLHGVIVVDLRTGGAAAVVADAVDIQPVVHAGLPDERNHGQGDVFADIDVAVVPGGLPVDQHACAVRGLPVEKGRACVADTRMLESAARTAAIVVLHAALHQDAGDRDGMAEGVRLPVEGHLFRSEAEFVPEVVARIEQMSADRFARRQILLALHPVDRADFPSSFLHSLSDLFEHRGIVALDKGIDGSLTLRVGQVRVLIHQAQHRCESVVGRSHRFRPAPHPVHVDMAVADAVDPVFSGRFADWRHCALGSLHGCGKARHACVCGNCVEQCLGLRDQVFPADSLLFGPCSRERSGELHLEVGAPQPCRDLRGGEILEITGQPCHIFWIHGSMFLLRCVAGLATLG